MGALLVADLGQDVLCKSEDLALIDTTELHVNVKVLLIEGLHERVKKTRERSVVGLFYDFSTGPLCVVLRSDRRQAEHIHHVIWLELVGGAQNELKTVDGNINGLEECGDCEAVVFGAELDELDRSFQVIEEAMYISEKDLDVAAGGQELGELEDGYKLSLR